MRSDFSLNNPYSIVRVQSNNHLYCIKVLVSCGVPWVTLHAKNIIWLEKCTPHYPAHSCFRLALQFPRRRFHQMYGVAKNACCRPTVSKSGVPYHREGCHDKPDRNDRSEERLGMKVLQQLRSPDSARTEKRVKTDAVFMQVRFPQIDFTSNLAHRKHASPPTHPHHHENTSWLHPRPLPQSPCRSRTICCRTKKVLDDFADIFFRPSVEAHKGSTSTASHEA